MVDAAVLKQLAPTGKLRLAIAVAPSPSAQFAIKEGDTYRGVAVTFGRALATKLGVPLEILPHQASGEIQNSAAANRWDVAFLPVDEERKKFVDFGNAYHLLQSTFLVAPGSKIQSVTDANAKGVGIGGVANTATFRAAKKATAHATHIDFAGVDAAAAAMRAPICLTASRGGSQPLTTTDTPPPYRAGPTLFSAVPAFDRIVQSRDRTP